MEEVAMVRMDKQLHTQMKVKCAIEQKKIKDVVDALVQHWLIVDNFVMPKQNEKEME